MAISATYITLQRQIADELGNRTDLLSALSSSSLTLSPVKNAIQSAIAKFEREPLYFNQFYDNLFFTTVNLQEFYTSADEATIATTINITRLHIIVDSKRYMLVPRRWQYLEDIWHGTDTGSPTDFAYFAQQIRLYPIPNGAFPISASGTQRLSALSADSDTNGWTQDGFDLIRTEAKRILAQEVLFDYDLAERLRIEIYGDPNNQQFEGHLAALRKETMLRTGGGLVARGTSQPPKGY